jgi:hypothetical protein
VEHAGAYLPTGAAGFQVDGQAAGASTEDEITMGRTRTTVQQQAGAHAAHGSGRTLMTGLDGGDTCTDRTLAGHRRTPRRLVEHRRFLDQHDRNALIDPVGTAGRKVGRDQSTPRVFERDTRLRAHQQIK